MIQDTGLEAVHAQTEGVVTATVPCVPPDPTDALSGAIVAEQTTPACVIVKVWAPTERVPVRLLRDVFAATLYAIVPAPLPVAPEVIEIQDADGVAVHEQPVVVSTLTVLFVAAAGTDALTGDSEYAHV